MTFLECLKATRGELFKASQLYCKSRGWHGTDRKEWYTAWQTTNLPAQVEAAVVVYKLELERV